MAKTIVDDLPHLCKLLLEVVDTLVIKISNKRGRPYVYSPKIIIKLFIVMVAFKIDSFRGLSRFLADNYIIAKCCGLTCCVPSYRTLSRRLAALDKPIAQAVKQIIKVLYQYHIISLIIVSTDSSLLEAKGKKPHKNKPKTYATDADAAWGWSGSRDWVFGYKLHMTSTVLWRGEIVPLSWSVTPANVHDTKPFLKLVENAQNKAHYIQGKIKFSLADKGYDYNRNYEWHDKNNMRLVTPVRRFKDRKEHPLKERTKCLVDSKQGKRLYYRRADTERLYSQLKNVYNLDPLPVIGINHVANYTSVICLAYLCGVLYNHLNGRSVRAIKSLVA